LRKDKNIHRGWAAERSYRNQPEHADRRWPAYRWV